MSKTMKIESFRKRESTTKKTRRRKKNIKKTTKGIKKEQELKFFKMSSQEKFCLG
jgi:hypothetical protein